MEILLPKQVDEWSENVCDALGFSASALWSYRCRSLPSPGPTAPRLDLWRSFWRSGS